MKQRVVSILVFVFVFTFLLAGCGGSEQKETAANGPQTAEGKKLKVGLAMNTLNNPFFVAVKEGAEAQAKELGIDLVVTDAQNNPGQQLADVENLLQQNLDVLIIDPADSDAIVEGVKKANDAKVPVFTIDRQSNGGEVVTHIGFDAIKSGNIAGEFLAKALNGKGNIVEIQGIMGTNVARDRSKGFNEVLAKYPDMKIIARQAADFDRGKALSVMENILQANPEIDGVYAANDEMALGALAAIEAAGRLDQITVIGCDAVDPALDAIRQGKLEATIAEPPFFLGKEAVQTAVTISKGESVEKSVILDSTLVTKENIDQVKTR
ncbi:substrate-binding domain-containing protein [Brevibacillus thermoruber]|jgi:ribose transport system substrate-binding protein|uniref:Substrate-binding domain-containing protein n=1 Tax=Brevibacillus thermoruber TaxID=33942 RepID=A0A9X3TNS8_9BACL|nr:substrate-binding domain-containing protein [Brevibacillus thermoruber]MDA5107924.1 substrate-binding domain-containing protein [Brevibacillus thermoruber]